MLGTGIRPTRQGRLLLIGEQPSTERMMGPRREGERERERDTFIQIYLPEKRKDAGRWRRVDGGGGRSRGWGR